MNTKKQTKSKIPAELEGVALTSDVDALGDKIDKCYSTERYEEFQGAVKKIVVDTLDGSDGRTKVKSHATEATKEYLSAAGWEKAKFWIPTVIAVLSIGWNVYKSFHP